VQLAIHDRCTTNNGTTATGPISRKGWTRVAQEEQEEREQDPENEHGHEQKGDNGKWWPGKYEEK
jgi:hypothetical protein